MISVDKREFCTWIVIRGSDPWNALTADLERELAQAITAASKDRENRAIVLTGSDRAFSVGHDVKAMIGQDHAFYRDLEDAGLEILRAIRVAPQPVIAFVRGAVTAAGLQIAASCDFLLAETGARFGVPGVKVGVFCSTPAVPLVRLIGVRRALDLLLTGRMIDTETAREWGLINSHAEGSAAVQAVEALVNLVAGMSPVTVEMGKHGFYSQAEMTEFTAYEHAATVAVGNSLRNDAQEGMQAFIEKRLPRYSGK